MRQPINKKGRGRELVNVYRSRKQEGMSEITSLHFETLEALHESVMRRIEFEVNLNEE